jgi:hypothetical protein
VAVSPDGQSVYVIGENAISAFSVGAEGKLSYQQLRMPLEALLRNTVYLATRT